MITKERLERIKENADFHLEIADAILMGDRENYDGADGARYVMRLSEDVLTLVAELERISAKGLQE